MKIFMVSRCAWTLYNFRCGLMRTLVRGGHRVVGGGAGGDGFEEAIEAIGVPYKPLPVDKKGINPVADVKLLAALYRWYRAEKPDVVHHFTIKPVIYGSIAARAARVPKIVNTITGLGYVFSEQSARLLRMGVENMYRVSCRLAHKNFFLNEEDLNLFVTRKITPRRTTSLLPSEGIDCRHFAPEPAGGRPAGRPVSFLMMARMIKEKGVYEYVAAARRVHRQYPQAAFYLLGPRDVRNPTVVPERDLRLWEAEGVANWLGAAKDVRPFIRQSDVIVLPTFYREGVPRSILEASAMGKPVITTDAVGCRDAVDDGVTGILVKAKDVDDLADAMIRLIRHPEERARMGQAGRQKVTREFDEETVNHRIVSAYAQDGVSGS